jgi:hypothetical protein
VWSLVGMLAAGVVQADVTSPGPGQWSGGVGVGFLANSPDGPEFGLAGHADRFVAPRLSVGPLVQYGGVGNDVIVAQSVQAKYWWSLVPGGRAKVVGQAGIGFLWASIEDADSGVADTYTSFVIPLGIGFDYALTPRVAVTADLILNITSLGERVRVGGREVDLHTNLIAGFFLGVRF